MKKNSNSNAKELRVSAQKLYFIQKSLKDLGNYSDDFLDSVINKLNPADEYKQTVTFQDILEVYTSLSNINIPAIGLNIGKRISCSEYGLYGCTLLCKTSLEDAIQFSIKYHTLVTRTTRLYLEQSKDGRSLYSCSDILLIPEIKNFNLELQIAINLTLMREVLGNPNFSPMKISYEFKKPDYHNRLEKFAKCKVLYEQENTFIELSDNHLRLPLMKSNPLAVPLLLKMCEQHIPDFAHAHEIVERVYNWVSKNLHNELKIDRIAEELFVSERTLRRKLAEQGTSFSTICATIKQSFAKQYIRETQLSFDDIAESLGFKETSNFRHAFKDWTDMTPTEYRNKKIDSISENQISSFSKQ